MLAMVVARGLPYMWKAVRRRKHTQRETGFPDVNLATIMPIDIPTKVAAVSWLPSFAETSAAFLRSAKC
jgi:hypothetical protein